MSAVAVERSQRPAGLTDARSHRRARTLRRQKVVRRSQLTPARLLDGTQDQPRHSLRLRHHGRMGGRHLLDPGLATLSHKSLTRRRDGAVLGAKQIPRWDGPPPCRSLGSLRTPMSPTPPGRSWGRAAARLAQPPESEFPEIAAWRRAFSRMGLSPPSTGARRRRCCAGFGTTARHRSAASCQVSPGLAGQEAD
jgi:hypothetical protein